MTSAHRTDGAVGRRARTTWAGQLAGRRLIATRANGQPAFVLYFPDPHGNVMHAAGLLVLTLAGDRISAITRFDSSVLEHFDLPRTLPTEDTRAGDRSMKE